jgi:hypothetical protein
MTSWEARAALCLDAGSQRAVEINVIRIGVIRIGVIRVVDEWPLYLILS